MRLILASASPRRAEILRDAGFEFETLAVHVDEAPLRGEPAEKLVLRLARLKAEAGASALTKRGRRISALVIGGDTEVVLDGRIFGKPANADEARAMLRQLSGRTHKVITGLCVVKLPGNAIRCMHEATRVTFARLRKSEIEEYVAGGEAFDKAGGYAIQGSAGRYITRVEGCYFNIVGLPLARLYAALRDLGGAGIELPRARKLNPGAVYKP